MRFMTEIGLRNHAEDTAARIEATGHPIVMYGVPRGGVHAVYAVAAALGAAGVNFRVTADPAEATVIVDDIIDSGKTRDRYLKKYPGTPFVALLEQTRDWVVFPWEVDGDGATSSADDIPRRLLQWMGEDVNRGGLIETPKRFLKAWEHYTRGYGQDPDEILKSFEDGAEAYNEMVLVRDINVYSHCEHHLAPFFGVAHVGYIPNGRIVGLSKLARLVDVFARRLQVQERLTNQIAQALEDSLAPKGVAVVLQCRHMCMESRGIQQRGTSTITSAMRGSMLEPAARAEFLKLVGSGQV